MLRSYRVALGEAVAENSTLQDSLHRAYRAIHTIHGGSGFLALTSLEDLSRRSEALLWKLEKETRAPSAEEVAFLHGLDEACSNILEHLKREGSEGPAPELLKGAASLDRQKNESTGGNRDE